MCRRKVNLLACAIESNHLSKAIAKVMPMRLGKVIERMLVEIEAARRHGMEKRLPEIRARLVDERDPSSLAPCERVAQACGKFQSRSTTTDDSDFMKCRVFLLCPV